MSPSKLCPYHGTCHRPGRIKVRFSRYKLIAVDNGTGVTFKEVRDYKFNSVIALVCGVHLPIYIGNKFKRVKKRKPRRDLDFPGR